MARKPTKAAAEKPEKVESKFSKNQLLAAERFRDRRDLLTAILSPDETYTVKAVEQMIEDFYKRKVR